MSGEINTQISFRVDNGYLSEGKSHTESTDMSGKLGPSPGGITVSVDGTNVDLSAFVVPGEVMLVNLDTANYVAWGLKSAGLFYPLGELLPGKSAKLRFSRSLGIDETEPGTAIGGTVTFHMRANTASCKVQVLAYEA